MNNRLQLQIETSVTGASDVQRLPGSLDNVTASADRVGASMKVMSARGAEAITALAASSTSLALTTTKLREAQLSMGSAFAASTAVIAQHSIALANAGSATEDLVNAYRGLRLALSPTPFTAATIAIGILTEETIRLTAARAKLISQQALISAMSGISISNVESLSSSASIGGRDQAAVRALFSALSSRSATDKSSVNSGLGILGIQQGGNVDPALLQKIAQGFSSIEDPAKRAAAAVDIFGKENAGLALDQLNSRFVSASQAVRDYGLTLDSVSRQQIFQFGREITSVKDALTDFAGLKGWGASVAQGAEITAAALDDMSRRGMASIDQLLRRVPGLQALSGFAAEHQSLSSDQLRGPASWTPLASGLTADNLFAQAQGAHARASQTLEGRKAAQAAAQAQADDAYSQLQQDAKKRWDNPNDPSLLSGDQRLTLATTQSSATALAASLGRTVKTMEDAAAAANQTLEIGRHQSEALLGSRRLVDRAAGDPTAGRNLQEEIQKSTGYVDSNGQIVQFKMLDETRRNLEAAFHAFANDLASKGAAESIQNDQKAFAAREALAVEFWNRQRQFQDDTAKLDLASINRSFAHENDVTAFRRDEGLQRLRRPDAITYAPGTSNPVREKRPAALLLEQMTQIRQTLDIQKAYITSTGLNDAGTIERNQQAAMIGVAMALKVGNITAADAADRYKAITASGAQDGTALNDKFSHEITTAEQEAGRDIVSALKDLQQKMAEAQQRAADSFASTAVQGFDAITQRYGRNVATRNFLEGQGRDVMNAVVGNAARDLFNSSTFQTLRKGLGVADPDTFPGNLLKGTFLAKDPMKDFALKDNTAKTDLNTTAIQDFTTKLQGFLPGSGGGSASGGWGGPGWGMPSGPGSASNPGILNLTGSGYSDDGLGDASPAAGALYSQAVSDNLPLNLNLPNLSGMGQVSNSPSSMSPLASNVAMGVTAAMGTLAAAKDFTKGNASGIVGGMGALAGTAGALVAMAGVTGPAAPILAGIGATLGIIGSFLGTGPQQRAQQISSALGANQYIAPTALNVTQSSGGTFADFDARGNMRTSNFSPYPQVTQGFVWAQTHGFLGGPPTYYNVPGGQTSQFGSQVTPVVHNHYYSVSAMDAKSFHEFAQQNHMAIGEAAGKNLQNYHGTLAAEVDHRMGR